MSRNVALYPLYVAFFGTMAWIPIFFLFFSQHLSLEQVLQLEAIYYVSVVLLEVPSGYFSDVVGRRATLLVSTIAMSFAYGCFLIADTFFALCGRTDPAGDWLCLQIWHRYRIPLRFLGGSGADRSVWWRARPSLGATA